MSWQDRQSFLGENSEAIMEQAVIGIAGLGGGGSHIVQQLAHIGIGNFVILDDDSFEDTNLNRVVGSIYNDIANASAKVDIARKLILGVNPSAKVTAHKCKWQEASDRLRACDIIVGGLDSVRAKADLEAFCRRLMIPYIDLGMDVHMDGENFLVSGQVFLSMPSMPCLRCFNIVNDKALEAEGRNYGAAGGKPQVVWSNGVLASTAVGQIVQLLTPWNKNLKPTICYEYDGNIGFIRPSERIKYIKSCCTHYSKEEYGDPLFDIRKFNDQRLEVKSKADIKPNMKISIWARFLRWLGVQGS